MPHSSGGGSHGGGFHSSSHGSSSSGTSTHYFHGARRYMYYDENGKEKYIYSRTKPVKPSLASVFVFPIFGFIFGFAMLFAIVSDRPQKLKADYPDQDQYVYDNIDVIADDEALTEQLKEFQDVTGICPVVYTFHNSDWEESSSDLEDFTFEVYVTDYSDEKHFVVVYSVPSNRSYDFSWEAVQGDDTDNIITESFFEKFGRQLNDDLDDGVEVGKAMTDAFERATELADRSINPTPARRGMRTFLSFLPALFFVGLMLAVGFLMYKNYRKEQKREYQEVPLTAKDQAKQADPKFQSYYSSASSVADSGANKAVRSVIAVVGIVFLIPFALVGLGMLGSGIDAAQKGDYGLLIFALFWCGFIAIAIFGVIKGLVKAGKKDKEVSLTAEYPEPDKGFAEPVSAANKDKAEASPASPEVNESGSFFTRKNQTDYDDEDYKRMKRQGYE